MYVCMYTHHEETIKNRTLENPTKLKIGTLLKRLHP